MISSFKLRRVVFTIIAFSFLPLFSQPLNVSVNSAFLTPYSIENDQNIILSDYNRYYEDGNISLLIAVDSQLVGEEKYFFNTEYVKTVFNYWLTPFETKFNIQFHVSKVVLYTPEPNDSLDISMVKVPELLSWNLAENQLDENNNGNMYDFLIIYQKEYNTGRNRVNSVEGNALIIAHNQPPHELTPWTSRQLILLHEVGHIFGGEHEAEGVIPEEWYGSATRSIMSYTDLTIMYETEWNTSDMPVDDHNFAIINSTKYRFDKNDADLDGMPNYYENRYDLDPTNKTILDSDDDGITDLEEYIYGTHPLKVDSDGDTFSDWAEVTNLSSPLNSSEIPSLDTPQLYFITPNQESTKNENITLRWRGAAKYRNSYSIFLNDTLQITAPWTMELIEYRVQLDEIGTMNFTCRVTDTQGNSVSRDIVITVTGDNDKSTEVNFSVLSLLFLIILLKYSKIKSNRRK